MLTRIISGAILILVVGAALVVGSFYPFVLALFIATITAIGCYEILNNTGIVSVKAASVIGAVFGAVNVLARLGYMQKLFWALSSEQLTVAFALVVVAFALVKNSELGIKGIAALLSFPVVISYSFSSLTGLYLGENGLFYLLLLLNFSSVCDTGAYFTGVLIGKHKLCPTISPKKTVEGAVGGIIWSIICSVILCFAFDKTDRILVLTVCTVVFCIIGMCGDLFASVIKRSVDLKDYGKLIPGHGGILDRFDSILLIAPVLNLCALGGII
ncbi:MAG: phosphatidate cytidylyltransferase [Acutalibacteraceae bacterium]|nr:phosphatidate cytidylyltransferase [Acutalibacteraceae bacterium]